MIKSLIKLVLLVIIFYLLLKYIVRFLKLLAPKPKKNEGDITIDYVKKKNKTKKSDNAEYIEYEEVK